MEDTGLILMMKDADTGLLTEEIGSYKIHGDIGLVSGACALKGGGETRVILKLTTERDVDDAQFLEIFEKYAESVYDDEDYIIEIAEAEDCYNPEWEILMEFTEDIEQMEERINKILEIHKAELDRIIAER